MKFYHQLLLVGASCILSMNSAFGVGFTNGTFNGTGFVTTDPLRPGWMNLPDGSTQIPGWTVVTNPLDPGAGIDWTTTWVAPAPGCTFGIDLNGYGPGGIEQTFDTTPGQKYLVTFALAGNVHDAPNLKIGRVSAAGQSLQFTFDDTGDTAASPGWVDSTFSFTATDSSSTLLFEGLNTGSAGGPMIDNVRVTLAPEPASLSMLSVAAAVLVRRRSRAR
jgi:choice-of-anchor C domain-containing protein